MTSFCRLLATFLTSAVLSAGFSARAEARIALTPLGCQSYATWAGNLVWASDLGADREKARADLALRDGKDPSSIYALMLRNLDSFWDTSADWEAVTVMVLQDCAQRRGQYEAAQ